MNNSFAIFFKCLVKQFWNLHDSFLEREDISGYQLLVKVTNEDEHAPSSTTAVRIVVVYLNVNAPRFNKKVYDVSILENVTGSHVLLVFHAPR